MPAPLSELDRRDALTVGTLVYYDTIRSGRVPCRIIDTRPASFGGGDMLVLKVTGARYAYPRGLVFTARRGPFVQAREAIR